MANKKALLRTINVIYIDIIITTKLTYIDNKIRSEIVANSVEGSIILPVFRISHRIYSTYTMRQF